MHGLMNFNLHRPKQSLICLSLGKALHHLFDDCEFVNFLFFLMFFIVVRY